MGSVKPAGVAASVALVLVAVALAFVGTGGDATGRGSSQGLRLVSPKELEGAAAEAGHTVYWAGRRAPAQLELDSEPAGAVYLRYLPPGVDAGEQHAAFLTIGSYPVVEAFEATRRAAAEAKAPLRHLAGGAIAFRDPDAPASGYLAFRSSDVQVEVYDPRPGRAMALIEMDVIEPVTE